MWGQPPRLSAQRISADGERLGRRVIFENEFHFQDAE